MNKKLLITTAIAGVVAVGLLSQLGNNGKNVGDASLPSPEQLTEAVSASTNEIATSPDPVGDPASGELDPTLMMQAVISYDGGVITLNDINEKLTQLSGGDLAEARRFENLPAEVQESVAKSLLVSKLLQKEAEAAGVASSQKVATMLAQVKEQIIQQEYLEKIANKQVSDSTIRKHYDEVLTQFKGQEEVKFRTIVIANEADANKAYDEIQAGAEFTTVAAKYTNDPTEPGREIGYMRRGSHLPQVEEALFSMPLGTVHAPFKTDFGWHIVKLEDRRAVTVPSLEEMKPQLQRELKQKVIHEYVEKLLNKHKVQMMWKKKNEAKPEVEQNFRPEEASEPAER